jgi:hypothetical protein
VLRLVCIGLALAAATAAGDPAKESKLARALALQPTGLPAVLANARFGMTAGELETALPTYSKTEGITDNNAIEVMPAFDASGNARIFVIQPPEGLDDAGKLRAMTRTWGAPSYQDARALGFTTIYWWPSRQLQAKTGPQLAIAFERYQALASWKLEALFTVTDKTIADAEKQLRVRVELDDGRKLARFALGPSEFGDVAVRARVDAGRLRDVVVSVGYQPGMERRMLEELGKSIGPMKVESDDPSRALRWSTKSLAVNDQKSMYLELTRR